MQTSWRDPETEELILRDISLDEPWALLERFSTLVRLSGSDDEAAAVEYITERLSAWGVPYTVHRPTCLISLPGPATLRTLGDNGREFRVKTFSFSPSTDGKEVEGDLVYVPGSQASDIGELFGAARRTGDVDLRGKVVITEGLGIAARGLDLERSGAIAAIFINPGERIHEGITTTAWGSPDLTSVGRVPPVPVLAINRPDGQALIQALREGPVRVAFSNQVETSWRPIPIIVAEIAGSQAADEFVLFHGHLDSWHVGIGDNATGDATLLEIARVFQRHRDRLKRTIRIAWWSGHSHGRYAGSTWYADTFAQDLSENCVAHVNCDSPGCRWATEYRDVAWMAEAADLCQTAIRDVTGQESSGARPLRAGDCSFNNLGISTYFMLSSTMPEDLVREKGYYAVGGCGGNIAWHTEDDTMEIADRDNLLRDMRVYATVLLRTLNAPIYPLDYRATVREIEEHLRRYQAAVGDAFDFRPSLEAAHNLGQALERFYEETEGLMDREVDDPVVRRANAAQRMLARFLVSVGYSRDGRFRQDPARGIPPLPELAPALELGKVEPGSDRYHLLRTDLTRGQNRLVWFLRQSARRLAGIVG
ncbi:M28 family peptidase [Sphaerobacter sp.]|uniref:M28 family peptidase n=1 Tax=Sphaerobacter sp. TaxID=2099654 RepID=UPI001D566EF7|nr:M28 family peptidase [Sphaerobacter sp.]MBX5445854.1 M28 family peptidase [Sphaerobacter sp.]